MCCASTSIPIYTPTDRLDRQVKTKELISLLSFYLARSHRYGLVSDDGGQRLRDVSSKAWTRATTLECAASD